MAIVNSGRIPPLIRTKKPAWMKHSISAASELQELLLPENDLEKKLLHTAPFREGLMWGEPRFGHPEGMVALHVREVLDNVDRLKLPAHQRQQLRLIAFAHDTFKFKEPKVYPRDWSRHHAVLARQFMDAYTDDKVVLTILEWHDEAFYIWRRLFLRKQEEKAHKQLQNLLNLMDDMLDMYYYFFRCDTMTGDKLQSPLEWFTRVVKDQGVELILPFGESQNTKRNSSQG
ncbi:MAG: hypothetical protein GYB31_03150 [Bacteroidetes bacterium]|nr:hypothetical protein [Bacteroidota bacterium]